MMTPLYCKACGSKLAVTEIMSVFDIKCGHCKCLNKFRQGTNFKDDRFMGELDWERAETKRIRRREKRSVL